MLRSISSICLLIAVMIVGCKSGQAKSTTKPTAVAFMVKDNYVHAELSSSTFTPGATVNFYRPEEQKTKRLYLLNQKHVATGKVMTVSENGLVKIQIVSGRPIAGDTVSTPEGETELVSYEGKILLCSKPDDIHIYGTLEDGLKPGTKLKVYRKISSFGDFQKTDGVMQTSKTMVGEIKVIGTAGSNYSRAELVKGKVMPGDIVELK